MLSHCAKGFFVGVIIMKKNHDTKSYRVWQNMKRRCLDKNSPGYKDYGGRGITVCDRWLSFENFFADMGERPKGLTIERIHNNGNYEPVNCKWATYTEQMNNKRNSVILFYKGKKQTVAQWAKELNINEGKIRYGISKGMTTKEVLQENYFDDSHYIVDKSKYLYYH
jgi:hypothetical protein